MQETSELRTVIESLYEIFVTYPLRADTSACACCHSAYDEQRLHTKPFRKLNADDLRQYAGDALFVWGEVDDFKHFLPRIFELEVAHGDSFVDPQRPNLMSWKSRTGFAVLLRPKPNCHRILESGLRRRRTMHA